ncbi:Transmembrane protein [Quillaja saponaria]|uniref:Transmembrane protein n=1 Tax=Quillaja saponaria TaxID=32244 RepID=A0AAD7QJP8_QUISA|nr:Transmembrane protein [Quillaja saponaria]
MEGEAVEFLDWEVLHNLEGTGGVDSLVTVIEDSRNFEAIEDVSGGVIRSDYFSLNNQGRHVKTVMEGTASEEGSVESDNPSWVDPGSETQYGRKNSGEFWSDSSSDHSHERKFGDFAATNELGLEEIVKGYVGPGKIGEVEAKNMKPGELIGSHESKSSDLDVTSEPVFAKISKSEEVFRDFGETQNWDKNLENYLSDSGEDGLASELGNEHKANSPHFSSDLGGEFSSNMSKGDEHSAGNEGIVKVGSDFNSGGGGEKKRIVWWKVPFEVLKYCVCRVNPAWSFSVAAALMGFIILGRRLYRMKRKTQSLQLKVTMDDKKVSQFMSRAARLNEAFSVVRRVPIIRPSLPAAGVTPWPVMSLR